MLIVCDAQVSPPLTEYTPHDYRNLVFGETNFWKKAKFWTKLGPT